jgi:hypothetical protein
MVPMHSALFHSLKHKLICVCSGGDACVDAAEVFAVNCVSVNAEFVPSIIVALVKQFADLPLNTSGEFSSLVASPLLENHAKLPTSKKPDSLTDRSGVAMRK